MLCHNQQWADEVRRHHGIEAVPVARLDSLRGRTVPVVVDLPVVWELALESSMRLSEVAQVRDIADMWERSAESLSVLAEGRRVEAVRLKAEVVRLSRPWWRRWQR
jgi:hypothetical protein